MANLRLRLPAGEAEAEIVGPEKPLRLERHLEKPGISGEFLQG